MDVGTVGLVVVASQPSVLSGLSCLGNGAFGFSFTNLTGARPFTATALPKRGTSTTSSFTIKVSLSSPAAAYARESPRWALRRYR